MFCFGETEEMLINLVDKLPSPIRENDLSASMAVIWCVSVCVYLYICERECVAVYCSVSH